MSFAVFQMLAQLSVQRSGWIFVLSNALKVGEMYSHQMNFVLFSIKTLKRFSVCCFVVLKFKILAMTWLNFFFFFSRDTHYLQISHFSPYKASCGRWPIFHIWKKFDPIMLKLLLFIILDSSELSVCNLHISVMFSEPCCISVCNMIALY